MDHNETRYPSHGEKLSYKFILDSIQERQREKEGKEAHMTAQAATTAPAPLLTEWSQEERQAIADGLRAIIETCKAL